MTAREIVRTYVPRWARNWARRPTKSARYLWDHVRFACGSTAIVEIRDGLVVRCHPLAQPFFDVFRTDPEQFAELDTFVRRCTPGMQLLDLGAHYGTFALTALHYGGPDSRVLCVEASRSAANVLQANLTLNGANSQCQILNVAVGAADGCLPMLTTGPFSGDYLQASGEGRRDATLISCRTIASVLSLTKFRPSHMKMDIEGSEVDVIHSSRELLSGLQPVLFLELHGSMISRKGQRPEQVIEDLRACGYRRFEIDGAEVSDSQMQQRHYDCRMICLA
jgi:FkbM family methyltransferase